MAQLRLRIFKYDVIEPRVWFIDEEVDRVRQVEIESILKWLFESQRDIHSLIGYIEAGVGDFFECDILLIVKIVGFLHV